MTVVSIGEYMRFFAALGHMIVRPHSAGVFEIFPKYSVYLS